MSYGYSARLIRYNKAAADSPGVRLGAICIAKDVSVASAAKHFGVSRQTIYNWFRGDYPPRNTYLDAIDAYCETLSA